MKNKLSIFLVLALCFSVITTVSASTLSYSIEGFYVVKDDYVITHLDNFPKNETFHVQMGVSDSLGKGYLVSKLATNAGGNFDAKFPIPDELKGEEIISIRLESIDSNKYYYDAFYNETGSWYSAATTSGGTTYNNWDVGDPQFIILEVDKGYSVTVQTKYFPENERFAIFMKDGALADKTWYEAGGFDSGAGGIQTVTAAIPSALQYKEKIAIKFYSLKDGYITYNLFLNQDYP